MEVNLLEFEKQCYKKGCKYIAGTDEAGRGPLAGPVVAAAVILPKNYKLEGLNDSKKLTEKKRDKFYDIIIKDAISYHISVINPSIIDEINIYQASKKGMIDAINNLSVTPDFILTDAMPLDCENHLSIIKGDAKSITIAAASVLAKVTRDNIMKELNKRYPLYEFDKHKGYPTKKHIEIIEKYGIIEDVYRFTFRPVMNMKVNKSKGIK